MDADLRVKGSNIGALMNQLFGIFQEYLLSKVRLFYFVGNKLEN